MLDVRSRLPILFALLFAQIMTAEFAGKVYCVVDCRRRVQYCGDLADVVLEEVGLEVQGRIVRRLLQLSVLARLARIAKRPRPNNDTSPNETLIPRI
jgi:hypothetical protein